MTAWANEQLPKVFLTQAEMKSKTQHEKGTDSLGRRNRIAIFVRTPADDFFGDLAIFSKRAFRLQHRHNRFEGITVDPHNALDFL